MATTVSRGLHTPAAVFVVDSVLICTIRLVGRGAAFAAAVVASRGLSATEFGIYAYIVTFLIAITLLGALGLEQVAVVSLTAARVKQSVRELHASLTVLVRKALRTLPVVSLMFALSVYGLAGLRGAFAVFATGVCLTIIVMAAAVLRGLDRPIASSTVQESGRGPAFLAGAGALQFDAGLDVVWNTTLVSSALIAVLAVLFTVTAVRAAEAQIEALGSGPTTCRTYAHDSQLSFVLVVLAANLFLWVCPVILKQRASISEVGLFNVAMQFPALISFAATSLEAMYVPKIAAMWHAGRLSAIQPLIRIGSRLTLIVGLPVIAVIVVYAERLLALYGCNYPRAAPAMAVIVMAQALSVSCGPCGYVVLLTGKAKLNWVVMAIGAGTGLCYLVFRAPEGGHMAAAVAFFIATAISNLFFALYCIKNLKINPTITAAFALERGTETVGGILSRPPC